MLNTSDEPISPTLQRMIEDMTARRYKEKVQKDYARHVGRLTAFLGRSPDTATAEEARLFQVHLAEQNSGGGARQQAGAHRLRHSALRWGLRRQAGRGLTAA